MLNGRNQAMNRENMFLVGRVSRFSNRVFFGGSETAAPVTQSTAATRCKDAALLFRIE